MRLAAMRATIAGCALVLSSVGIAAADTPTVTVPTTVKLPDLEPLIEPNADPAADHFLEIDFSHRPPAGATSVQRIGAWVTPDGVFHWPFVMRIRNIGDKPFQGKAGEQFVIVTEEDLLTNKKKEISRTPFDHIEPRSGVAARFEFAAPAESVQKPKFHRIYTLAIKFEERNGVVASAAYTDGNLQNNSFKIEFDSSKVGWIFQK